MPRPLRSLAALTATASLLVTLAAPLARASPVVVVVTPAQAQAIVLSFIAVNNKANATYDTVLQDKHEEGAARAVDDALFRIAKRVGVGPLPATAAVGTRVFVPRQTGYPAVFVALLHPKLKGQPASAFTAAFVFRRDSARATWKVADGTTFPGAGPALALGADGYLPTLRPQTLLATPTALYPLWIAAQNRAARGATVPAVWARNSLFRKYIVLSASAAAHDRVGASSAHFAPLCVASTVGALCFVVTTTVDDLTLSPAEVAAGAGYRVDTVDQQISLGGIDRGVYDNLHFVSQRSVAITVPRKGAKGTLQLVGYDSEAVAGRGVKA